MPNKVTAVVVMMLVLLVSAGCTQRRSPAPPVPDADQPAAVVDKPGDTPVTSDDRRVVSFDSLEVRPSGDDAEMSFSYRRPDETMVEYFSLKAIDDRRTIDLSAAVPASVLARLDQEPTGRVTFPLATRYLPRGRYRVEARARLVGNDGDGVLLGNGIIYSNPTVGKLTDYTFRYRFATLTGGHSAIVRARDKMTTKTRSWLYYYAKFDHNGVALVRSFLKHGQHWQRVTPYASFNIYDRTWHDVAITCKGATITVVVDGKPLLEYTDPDKYYMDGGVGFWQGQRTCVVDDVTVTELSSGKTVIEDHFDAGRLADHWSVASGDYRTTPGQMMLPEPQTVGTFRVQGERPSGFPSVTIRREMDASRLYVNDQPLVPLILSFSTLHRMPNDPEAYRLPRRAAVAGMPILAPTVSRLLDTRDDGTIDYSRFDAALTQLVMAAPEAWIFPRFKVPDPPSVPKDEKMQMAHGPNEPLDELSKASQMQRFIGTSTASTTYREFVLENIDEVMEHIRNQPYATRIIGMTLTGGGYEGNWGVPSGKFGTVVDISPAMHQLFGTWLKDKYRTEAACAKAWGVESVDFEHPPLPDRKDRTTSDFAGFRDPSRPRTTWLLDFGEFYGWHMRELMLQPLWRKLHDISPDTFWGRFGLFTFNWQQGGLDRQGRPVERLLIDNPGMQHVVGCLTYGDRKAGGVSIYTNSAWESLRLRGRIAIGEADIRTVQGRKGPWYETSYHDSLQTMRREFGHAIITKRMGLWYYDMWLGWFDHPLFLEEFNAQAALARRAREVAHRNIGQTLIVSDLGGLRNFASWTGEPLAGPEYPPRASQVFIRMLGLEMDQSMMRVGTPRDKIILPDLWNPDLRDYNLYVFKTTYDADAKTRGRIHQLLDDGKTVFMTWAAGLTDQEGIGTDRMSKLLGMTVKTDQQLAPMACKTVKLDHPLLKGLPEGTVLGNLGARAMRFWIEPSDDLTVLARYDDGKVAAAVKKMGAGHMVYSAVPITQPAFLRNLSRFAGNHLFTEEADAFYADNHFIVLHTRRDGAGKRTIRLPHRVGTIVDLVTGRVVARDTDHFTVELPEKTTGLWYYGDQPEQVRGVSLGPVIPRDEEPEPLKR